MEVVEGETDLNFPRWKPIRRQFASDAPFFAAGNVERELLAKQVALDLAEENKLIQNEDDWGSSDVICPIVGCGVRLKSSDDFENHYNARHMASCSVCLRVYPTSRLLGIHVSEAHDSFFQAKVARGYDMYECLVEGCGVKLKSYKSRQQHMVDKHKFPPSFEFFKKARPSKKKRHKLPKKQEPSKPSNDSNAMQVDEDSINGLSLAVSRLTTSDSPSSVSFGHRHARGLAFVPRTLRKR